MRNAVLIFLVLFLSTGLIAQKPSSGKKRVSAGPVATAKAPKPPSEKEQFVAASAHELAGDRVAALQKFLTDFPESEHRTAAQELIASSRVLLAEEKLLSGDRVGAAELYKLVIEEAPKPFTNQMFRESIAAIPATLFWRGARPAAFEIARLIETHSVSQPPQLVELANFYISIENGDEALRLSQAAIALDPNSAAAYRTLALAYRVNFDLEQSAAAYAKALELEPDSATAKRGLAEMKRALGQPAEAEALYRNLLTANENDPPTRTGLVLSLFEGGKQAEAESELAKSLEQNPGNVILMAGAAYWYAANKNSDKAIELAQKAIEKEPRYIWSHIALGRGHMAKGNPVQAEQVLVKARKYGNFPTLEYELASARVAAGFFREAAEGITKSFEVSDGTVKTKLGGRVQRSAESFSDLVADERRASIFTPIGAVSPAIDEQLKHLVEFTSKINAAQPDEAEVAAAAGAFAAGSDNMRLHRQLYAADTMLQKKVALSKVLELTQAATGNTDAGLDVPNPSAAVMANELYNGRAIAFSRDEFLLVPDVPKQTLSAIMRGQVEEIAGWTLYQQDNFPAAVVRLRRAVSVLPPNSAWWRSSLWRLGAAQEASGLDKEALSSYVESYRADKPDYAKFVIVESLYRKINGSTEGLDALLGQSTAPVNPPPAQVQPTPAPTESAAAPAAETIAEPVKVPVQEPVRFPRSVPVALESAKTETAAPEIKADTRSAEVPEKVETSTTESINKTADLDEAAAVPSPAERVPASTPETANAKQDAAQAVDDAGAKRAEITAPERSSEQEVKTQAPAPARVEAKPDDAKAPTVDAEKAVVAEPTSDSTAAPTEEKKAEASQPTLDTPAATDTVTNVEQSTEQKVEVSPAETPIGEVSSPPPAELTTEDTPPTPAEKRPAESHVTPVEIKREEPPSPRSAEGTEVKISPASIARSEDNPPPVRLKVERTSTLPLDGKPIVITPKKPAPETPTEPAKQASNKPLFEPIIITVPKQSGQSAASREPPRTDKSEVLPVSVKRPSGAASNGVVSEPNLPTDHTAGSVRPRIVVSNTLSAKRRTTCSITSDRDKVSVARNDGGVGLQVGLEGVGDVGDIEALSSSPGDVEAVPNETDGPGGRRSYIIRSISEKTGVFQVKFEAPCGSKVVDVMVR